MTKSFDLQTARRLNRHGADLSDLRQRVRDLEVTIRILRQQIPAPSASEAR